MSKGFLWRVNLALEFGASERERLYLKLATYLRAGVKISDALDMMWRIATDDGKKQKGMIAKILAQWRRHVANGKSLANAMKDTIPVSDYVLINAGEESGKLDAALQDAVYIAKARKRMVGAIIGGLAYPALLLNMIFVFFFIFTTSVLPSFQDIMPREQWFGYPAVLADTADAVVVALPYLVAVAVALLGASLVSLPRWTARSRVGFERLPPWSIYKTLEGAGFMVSLAALIKSGVKLPDALKILASHASPWLRSRIMAAQRQVSNGLALGDALYRTRLEFPSRDIVMDMRTYSQMDGFEDALERIGRDWVDSSAEMIKKNFDAIKNILIVLFGMVFVAIASGIFTMQDMITTSLSMQR